MPQAGLSAFVNRKLLIAVEGPAPQSEVRLPRGDIAVTGA